MSINAPTTRLRRTSVARNVLGCLLSLTTALSPVLATVAPARANDSIVQVNRPQQTISLGLDKSKVIDLPVDAHDILVANPVVADAVTRTARRIYIFGKQVGQTNIFIFDARGKEIAVLDLRVERDVAGLEGTIRKYITDADVKVEILNDNVVLTGTVQTPQDAARAVQLAQIYLTGGEATTGNFIKSATSGSGPNGGDVELAQEQRRESQIVNLLQIQGEDQVTLKVTVAEVQRSVVKQLGFNTQSASSIDGIGVSTLSESVFGLGKAQSLSGLRAAGAIGSSLIDVQMRAMEQAGVMRTLAEPSLTAISGEQASFKVGGSFSIPKAKEETLGTDAVEPTTEIIGYDTSGRPLTRTTPGTPAKAGSYKYEGRDVDYGIGLDFTPVVLSPGRISLKLRTSVSEPTFESPFTVHDGLVPATNALGVRKRMADTTVELPSGGSLVIAGLVRDETRQVISGYPGLAKIPVLGTLFRSRDFQHYETELVIIVTPYLVRPVARKALARPDDGLAFSSDGAGNFLGRINRVYGAMETDLPPGRYHGVVGYIYK